VDTPEFLELGRGGGVRLLAAGSGPTVVVFPGMEGSGESCVRLASGVVLTGSGEGRLVLVDYAQEQHRFLGALVETIAGLLERHVGRTPLTLWGQSFGNLLVAGVAPLVASAVRATVLVSPFTGLPAMRTRLARAVLSVTPQVLYSTTVPVLSRGVFGPAPRGTGDEFFAVLGRMRVADLRRRVGWLAGGDLAGVFQSLPGPVGVWFADQDRLVDLPRQIAFFTALTRALGGRVTVLDGCGHVVCPKQAVQLAIQDIQGWLIAPSPAPGHAPAPTVLD
jgi:pimeloyl-ACP methyl ester carboxylesterase